MGPGEWIAAAALALSCLTAGAGIVYRLGQVMAELEGLTRRMDRVEGKLDRVPKRKPPEPVG